jgi:hypothetical protein
MIVQRSDEEDDHLTGDARDQHIVSTPEMSASNRAQLAFGLFPPKA